MPLGKYYCDYCDKQFQDTAAARKRHLQGVHHQRARALWYDSFKEPHGGARLFQPDGSLAAGVCHHFVRTGVCKYGEACRYFHPKQDLQSPVNSVAGMNYAVTPTPFQNNLVSTLPGENFSGNIINQAGVSWGNLPPSLRPPPEGGYLHLPLVDWG